MNIRNQYINPPCSAEVKFTLVHTVLSILFVGCIVTVMGLLLDCRQEVSLMAQGGLQAVDVYHQALQASPVDSSLQCLILALQWHMPTTGGNLQILGLAACYLLAPAYLAISMVRRLVGNKVRVSRARFQIQHTFA